MQLFQLLLSVADTCCGIIRQWLSAGRPAREGVAGCAPPAGAPASVGLAEETAGIFHLQVVALLAGEASHVAAILLGTGTRRGRSLETRLVHVADIRNGLVQEFWSASLEPSKEADFRA